MNWLLACSTAALLILTFPRFDLRFLAPVALAPLLIAAARERRWKRRFLLGWTAGVAYWIGVCYWIQPVLEVHAGMGSLPSIGAFALFCVIKALHLGAFALLAGVAIRSRLALVAVPALWVAIESTHGWLGFAWLALGNAGITMSLPLRVAPFAGVYGVSFVFAMMATAPALIAERRPRIDLAPLALLAGLWFFPALPEPEHGTQPAALVQPNISQTADWTEQWTESMHRRLEDLSLKGVARLPENPSRMIVWPEAPAPMYYFDNAVFRERVNRLARTLSTYVLLNAVPFTAEGRPFNSAILVSPEGKLLGRYDKMNLVPFGEFVPWPFGALVQKVSSEAGDFEAGARQSLLPARGFEIGAFVCYESVFPNFVRKFAAQGAEVLVNISNDGWYGRSAARDQHLAIVRMRAVESRRWVLRATNDGITSTIDPGGRLGVHLPSYTEGVAATAWEPVRETTFYSRHGDWFVLVCAGIAVGSLVAVKITG